MPKLFDNNSIEQWKSDGAKDIKERALSQAKRLLHEYEEPKLDPAKDEELRAYMDRRSREIPAVDALNDEH
jgi:trimethylamine--corrinoid protein Co-methyltransferase